jgi:hypothetical protein
LVAVPFPGFSKKILRPTPKKSLVKEAFGKLYRALSEALEISFLKIVATMVAKLLDVRKRLKCAEIGLSLPNSLTQTVC